MIELSYRPDNQAIGERADDLLQAILDHSDELIRAINNRALSGEWKESHIEELSDVINDIQNLKIKLVKISQNNW